MSALQLSSQIHFAKTEDKKDIAKNSNVVYNIKLLDVYSELTTHT